MGGFITESNLVTSVEILVIVGVVLLLLHVFQVLNIFRKD